MQRFNKEEDEKQAENILNCIETWEDLSQLTLQQLFALQRFLGYVIEEKINEQKG